MIVKFYLLLLGSQTCNCELLWLTGDFEQILMCWCDKEIMERLRERGMEVMLYKRLVYDINMVWRKTGGGDIGYEEYRLYAGSCWQNTPVLKGDRRLPLKEPHKQDVHTRPKSMDDKPVRPGDAWRKRHSPPWTLLQGCGVETCNWCQMSNPRTLTTHT